MRIFLGTVIGVAAVLVVVPAWGVEWPTDVCRAIKKTEAWTVERYANAPVARARARGPLLALLRDNCGVDISAKERADNQALAARPKQQQQPVARLPDIDSEPLFLQPHRSTNCTTLMLDRDLATTNCD